MPKYCIVCVCICLCCWVVCCCCCAQILDSFPNDLELVKTIVLFRHGMRAPLNPFEFDEFAPIEEIKWPEGYGTLVQEGKMQMYELGKQLRERYQHLLIPYGNTVGDDVKVVTTSVDRCYLSAALMLAGFYPPDENQAWNNDLLWQPVPILSTSPDKVHIIGKQEKCPGYHEELLKVYEMVKYDENINYLISYLSNFTHPVNITNAYGLFLIGDYFHTKRSLNLSLPYWADEDFLHRLDDFYVDSFNYLTHTPKMRNLLAGPLIKDIIHRVQETVHSEPSNSKFYFYSGHDSSLQSIFDGMSITKDFVPTYGASFIFEVYRSSSNDHSIKILYSHDYSLSRLNVKVLPNCEEYCPMGKFVKIFDQYMSQDWEKECKDIS